MQKILSCLLVVFALGTFAEEPSQPDFVEDWSSGEIDPARWYMLRKKWGRGNHGVVPDNVRIGKDQVRGKEQSVLICTAHGDQYTGSVTGMWGKKTRVGGVIVTKEHFASGRYEVVMKLPQPLPKGAVPAIWTYGYRAIQVPEAQADDFVEAQPLYNPYVQEYGKGLAFYWSEIDFPEFGKGGRFDNAMYNTFFNKRHHSLTFDTSVALDGAYHTYTTEWRTGLKPIKGVRDEHVIEHEGVWWVHDKAIPFDSYLGAPLKRIATDSYQVYAGTKAAHFIDGQKVGENTRFVPSMSAQLNLGVWLPEWAGPADWEIAEVYIASVKIWSFNDAGDVGGFLTEDITNNF